MGDVRVVLSVHTGGDSYSVDLTTEPDWRTQGSSRMTKTGEAIDSAARKLLAGMAQT